MSQGPSISVTVNGTRNEANVVFNTNGAAAAPPSAGVPVTAVKASGGQVVRVNGTVAGVVADIPSGK